MTQITDNGNLDEIEQFRELERKVSSSGEVDSESVENSQNEFENESAGDEITENNNKSAESSPGEVTGDEPAESDVPGEPVDNSTENGQGISVEKSPEPDQNNDSLDEKSEKSETFEPQCENVVMENDQQSDNFGDFEEKTDEFDDFGDFQDDNDDFGDFGDFEEPAPEPVQEAIVPPTSTETLTLGNLVDDIEKLRRKSEKSRKKFETDESTKKCVLSLFDCVNASALDFSWRNSNFDEIMAESTPVLIAICEKSSQQRRKMQLEAINEKNAKTMSVEAAELLDRLPDLSWVQQKWNETCNSVIF